MNFGQAGKNLSQGNFDYSANGSVDTIDFNLLASKFGQSLPAPSARFTPAAARPDPVDFDELSRATQQPAWFSTGDDLLNDLLN